MLLLHSLTYPFNESIRFLNTGHNFIFQQSSTNTSFPQCHFPINSGNFTHLKLVNKYVFHDLLVIQDFCGIVIPKPQCFLRVLVNTAPVILSTILLPCSIFDAGDCEQFYKISICEFYFIQDQTQLLEVFSL